jgi:glutathione peroxidase
MLSTISISAGAQEAGNIYGFKAKTIDGEDFSFSSLKGKKIMIVNVASKCGLTPQYAELQELYDRYKDKNFVIVGFPANNFGSQEPGTNAEIREFCSLNYGVTFPLMEKISVKGEDIAPVYQWLTKKENNKAGDAEVTWNFQKFLIDEHGRWVKSIPPKVKPLSEEIIAWLESK